MLLSGVSSLEQLVLLLVWNRAVPSPAPCASVYLELLCFIVTFHTQIFFYDSFGWSNICWYVAFQGHYVLADVSFLIDFHSSAVLGHNFPK